ncbi:1698_t:CDS:2 [Funneliformis geosporum]|uniref:15081_t:CDS:1 n=1 Tax=Funneliformis geosporum TaxID=1117311 RepID=A0A9W4SUK7_9GLOM|nr:1698_t:CDS:2 [Funneliformis geosporum]CAI2181136.1 15081_t:CDS:2 [Funneliformis geosporum]
MSKPFKVTDSTWTIRSVDPCVANYTHNLGGEYSKAIPENPLFVSILWSNPLNELIYKFKSIKGIFMMVLMHDIPDVSAKVQDFHHAATILPYGKMSQDGRMIKHGGVNVDYRATTIIGTNKLKLGLIIGEIILLFLVLVSEEQVSKVLMNNLQNHFGVLNGSE